MDSIIREMLSGMTKIEEIPLSAEYRRLREKAELLRIECEKTLNGEQLTKFRAFCDVLENAYAELTEIYLVQGTKLGIRAGMEASHWD